MNSGIYLLTFANGSTYIGKSIDIERRYQEHLDKLYKNTAARKMQDAYILSNYNNPECTVLQLCHPDHIDILETYHIWRNNPNLNTSATSEILDTDLIILGHNRELFKKSTVEHIKIIDEQNREIYKLSNTELGDQLEINKRQGMLLADTLIELNTLKRRGFFARLFNL